jgi:hypothetical protein
MAVHCAKCGEELLGAVNRCWKCGQNFELRPEIDGRPPVRLEMPPASPVPDSAEAVDVIVLDEEAAPAETAPAPVQPATIAAPKPPATPAAPPPAAPRPLQRRVVNASELVEARRKSAMAMGGTVAAIVLGVFATVLAPFRFEAAFIGLIGVVMGIWGLYSPRRSWALAAMLLCCLAVGLGAFTGTRQLYLWIQKQTPIEIQLPVEDLDS